MRTPLRRALCALLLTAACTTPDAPGIHDPAECQDCRIALTPVASLTTEDPGGQALYPSTLARRADGSFILGPTLVPGTVGWYDAAGEFRGSIGRSGRGPGEMREVVAVNAWFGDSVAVVHDRNQFLVYGPDTTSPRAGRFESPSFFVRYLTPVAGTSVLAVRFGTNGSDDHPLREFSTTGEPGQGYGEPTAFGMGDDHAAAIAFGDTVWAIRRRSYVIDVFSRTSGEKIRTVSRHLDWFPPDPETMGFATNPDVVDIARAPSGRFWVLVRRPRPEFTAPRRPRASSEPVAAGAGTWGVGDEQERFEYFLELLDLEREVLVASESLGDRVPQRFLDGDHLYGYEEDPNTGSLTVLLWRLGLVDESSAE